MEFKELPALTKSGHQITDRQIISIMETTIFATGDKGVLFSYSIGSDSDWKTHYPPIDKYSLVVYDSKPVLAGGVELSSRKDITDRILIMKTHTEFQQHLSPMKEKRHSSSSYSSGSTLFVVGGIGESGFLLRSGEIYTDGQWKASVSLPMVGCAGSLQVFINSDQCFLKYRKKVHVASLQVLLSGEDKWEQLPDPPIESSASAYFSGHLLSIGGGNMNGLKKAIYAFSFSSWTWEHVADLPVPLKDPAAAVLSDMELVVIGHYKGTTKVYRGSLKGNECYMHIFLCSHSCIFQSSTVVKKSVSSHQSYFNFTNMVSL